MNASSGWPAFCALPLRSSRAGPTAPVVPAAASAWQPPQPALPVKMVFPLAGSPAAPDVEPPVDPPLLAGGGVGVEVGVEVGVDVPLESEAVESGSAPTPTLVEPSVVEPPSTITTIITTTPATVPMSPATRTLIMAAGTISGGAAGANTPSRGWQGQCRTPTWTPRCSTSVTSRR